MTTNFYHDNDNKWSLSKLVGKKINGLKSLTWLHRNKWF